jgi:hypothetical protein
MIIVRDRSDHSRVTVNIRGTSKCVTVRGVGCGQFYTLFNETGWGFTIKRS